MTIFSSLTNRIFFASAMLAVVSIGVAIYPDHALGRGELVSCADQALYRAKKSGRDRVVVAETAERVVAVG